VGPGASQGDVEVVAISALKPPAPFAVVRW
jgi:hypothetical protein